MLAAVVRSFPGALGFLLRRSLCRRRLAACGRNVIIGRHVEIRHPERVRLGDGVIISDRCLLDAGKDERLELVIGDGVFISAGTVLRADGGSLEVGEGSNLGSYCDIFAGGAVRLERNVLLAAYTAIGDRTGTERKEDTGRPTVVEEGCWLGVRVRVSPGVRIGHDTVVGAHAAVTEDLPPFAIAFGNPARVRKERRAPL